MEKYSAVSVTFYSQRMDFSIRWLYFENVLINMCTFAFIRGDLILNFHQA